MHIITKSFTVNCGHRLLNYKDKRQQLHGHTYTITFGLYSELINDTVTDYSELTKTLKIWLLETLDHKLLLANNDPIALLLHYEPENLEGAISNTEVAILPYNTTSENIARYICEITANLFPQVYEILQFVEVAETPTTSARYYPKKEVEYYDHS